MAYLAYRWFVAMFFLFGLIQSLVQNTLYFLSVNQTENVYKYFIYLTNNGRYYYKYNEESGIYRNLGINFRLLAVLALSLEASLVTLRWRKETQGGSIGGQPGLRYRISWILSNINSSFSGWVS